MNMKEEKENEKTMNKIMSKLEKEGFDYAIAIATEAEIKTGAACGQLAIISKND